MALADTSQTGIANAAGRIEMIFTPSARQDWTIQQCSVDGAMPGAIAVTAGGLGPLCSLYLDAAFIATLAMPQDVGAGEPFPKVRNGRKFRVVITGAAVGSLAQATILYDDGQGPSE